MTPHSCCPVWHAETGTGAGTAAASVAGGTTAGGGGTTAAAGAHSAACLHLQGSRRGEQQGSTEGFPTCLPGLACRDARDVFKERAGAVGGASDRLRDVYG